jgi:hypothetical protein
MGMYDELTCEYPLLEKHKKYQEEIFQTKSLINCLDKYVITKDGELVHHSFNWDVTPEEERPYYKDPNWDKFSWVGAIKTVPNEPVKLEHTGEVRFYHWDNDDDNWIEYVAFFSKGKLIHFEFCEDKKL